MPSTGLHGVLVTPLAVMPDERGQVMHFMRADAPYFRRFGEVYFSVVYPGVIKGWRIHSASWSNMVVPQGRIKYVLHDLRDDSPTKGQFQEVYLGDNRYALLTIPPGIAYAWKNLLADSALIANCASELWSPHESKTLDLGDIAYTW